MRGLQRLVFAAALALTALSSQAVGVVRVVPQGEVAQVRQLVIGFDAPAVRLGDAQASAPVTLQCNDTQATAGQGRWNNEREWVFQFNRPLPPGVRCTVQRNPAFRTPDGSAPAGAASWQFATGGPFVQSVRPGDWERIDEEQFFVLQLNGAATPASVLSNTHCAVEGLGEKVPVLAVDGAAREGLLQSYGLEREAAREPERFPTLRCARRLPPSAKLTLVVGPGLATASGLASKAPQRFTWQVREAFAAEFSCERENANADCLPLRPLRLSFNAPVARKLAAAIVLKSDGRSIAARPEGEGENLDALVQSVEFPAPLPEKTRFRIELPANFQDASGRSLRNAANFPLAVATAPMPPLLKFAAAPFGIVERFAEGPDGPALLPVTVRNVEALLRIQDLPASQLRELQPQTDADIIAWLRKVRRFDAFSVPRSEAAAAVRGPLPPQLPGEDADRVQTRMVSLLAGQAGVRTLELPKPASGDPRPFEVLGIPLTPGFHVLEVASPRLGQSLLDERYGPVRSMTVRTSVLVTNLGVHFKLGREDALAWVTTLDKGQPVAGAQVQVSSCDGRVQARGTTDAQGVVRLRGLAPQAPACPARKGAQGADAEDDEMNGGSGAWFVSARARDARGVEDLAFVFSDWNRGIETWRFNVPTDMSPQPTLRAHTVFDRTLLRAGETVSMKHVLRSETANGFGLPPTPWPDTLTLRHTGSGQVYTQPLQWRRTASGGLSAESQFQIPAAAKLGQYETELGWADSAQHPGNLGTGAFRVEEFRLPVFSGRVAPADTGKPLIAPTSVPVSVQIGYVSGGPAVNLPVQVSALTRDRALSFPDFADYSFQPPRGPRDDNAPSPDEGGESRVLADKLPLMLDRQGAGRVTIIDLLPSKRPRELLLEARYADPNGEIQTLRSTQPLWPAGVIVGLRTEGWVSTGEKARVGVLALGLDGKPMQGVAVNVRAVARTVLTSRKRMVGGFYTYDNQTRTRDLGTVCSGSSDAQGRLACDVALSEAGEVELIASARDAEGRSAEAARSVWVTRQGELWFGGQDHDRMDLLPEKPAYEGGETARFQVRMPFRRATALLTVDREGVLEQRVVEIDGRDPTITLPVKAEWGPNVFVSVLALRGRLIDVPWYSFFTWGYKAPREWWRAFWIDGRDYRAPTALVDLSKPAYRLGLAEIRVGASAHRLDVKLQADRASYPVRGTATVSIQATLPDGKPAAGAEVALAVVDEALLELLPNRSWNLLEAMLARRSLGVETATAQMEIVGRRHYGRKALPAGGGGGQGATRELFDTLALWQPRVQLDARGRASVKVPVNDALTTWRIVAVADSGLQRFGTGSASVRTTQDVQLISGLPPVVREGDRFRAAFTVRNTTARAMQLRLQPRAALLELAEQTVAVPAGESREVVWEVTAPALLAFTQAQILPWEVQAQEVGGSARDALKLSQRLIPAVPLEVEQATLRQLDGSLQWPVAAPAQALRSPDGRLRGGLRLSFAPRLSDGLPGVRDWFAAYPYGCLEQKTSKTLGLRDLAGWKALGAQMPSYLDADGLARYFPPREGEGATGSDILSAYLLAASHEAAALNPAFALPAEVRDALLGGLSAFVEGRLERKLWGSEQWRVARKLAALEALSRYGRATPRQFDSLGFSPDAWSAGMLIDTITVLQRTPGITQREARLAQARQALQARLNWQGTRLALAGEADDPMGWLMRDGDAQSARLLLLALDDAGWKDELGRLALGLIARQQRGAWATTTANLWGSLALEKFSTRNEATPVRGSTRASLGSASATVDWDRLAAQATARGAPAPAAPAQPQASPFGAPAAAAGLPAPLLLPWSSAGDAGTGTLVLTQQGSGKPWVTVQSVAAIARSAPFNAGYTIKRSVTPTEQAQPGALSRGDVLRVRVEIEASADMAWVALTDPVPAGATVLGSGLGRDSEIATRGEQREGWAWPAFEERGFESLRVYYEHLPRGRTVYEYTLRLNTVGDFALPPTRVEALYAPEMRGVLPNARVVVKPAP